MGQLPPTEGSRLRPLEEDDADELHALIEANRARLAVWMPWAAGQAEEDTGEFIRRSREQAARNDGFQAAVVREGEIAGVAGFHFVDWAGRTTSIGYWLGEAHEGRGTMTEVVRALTDHALGSWDLVRVEIRVATGNQRSRRIPERLGFDEEGVLRRSQRVGDRHLDYVVYAMVAPGP